MREILRELVDFKAVLTRLFLDVAVPKWAAATATAIVTYFLPTQAQREAMAGAVSLILIDLISGIIASKVSGKPITSAKASRTLVKLFGYGSVIHVVAVVTRSIPGAAEFQGASVSGVLGLIIATEGISVLENARTMGCTLPPGLEKWLQGRVTPPE